MQVKDYLNGLRVDAETSLDGEEDDSIEMTRKKTQAPAVPDVGDGRDFERWLFSDWLNNGKGGTKPGRQKEPALPILKEAKWNSGDNPVLVASALIGLSVIIASLTERVGSQLSTL